MNDEVEAVGSSGGQELVDAAPVRRRNKFSPRKASYLRRLVQYKIAEAMPEIVDKLAEEAKAGSLEHTKEFLKLASAERRRALQEPPRRRAGKGFAQELYEELRAPTPKPDPADADADF